MNLIFAPSSSKVFLKFGNEVFIMDISSISTEPFDAIPNTNEDIAIL